MINNHFKGNNKFGLMFIIVKEIHQILNLSMLHLNKLWWQKKSLKI